MRKFAIRSAGLFALALSASAASAQDSVRFAAFGDFGAGTSGTTAVSKLVNNRDPNFIVALGDICYGSSPPIATQVGTPYGNWVDAGRFWPSLGNHEFSDACGGGNAASGYRAYFTLPNNERYYDFVRGPVHFFALNSANEPDGKTATSTQAQWLKAKLAASTSPWQIVFFHHTAYSSGGSTKVMQWPFEAWGVDAVLAGHAHIYERVLKDANADKVILPYFTSGLGGRSRGSMSGSVPGSAKKYNAQFGSLFATATASRIDFEFRNVNGTVIDSYAVTKPAAAPSQIQWKVCC